MFAHTYACTLLGSEALPVVVEATAERGLPALIIIGLRASERSEVKERILCGLRSMEIEEKLKKIVVSIAPADLPKSGAALDLSIMLAILASLGYLKPEQVANVASHGEIGLDGKLRAAPGVVASAFAAVRAGVSEFIVADECAQRAALAPTTVTPAPTIQAAMAHLIGKERIPPAAAANLDIDGGPQLDLSDIRGQASSVEAATIAAAGGHNLLLFGVPGCGKTMLAQRIPTILPDLEPETALEVATIHDAAGLRERDLDSRPPFRSPHHTVTQAALVGGGGRMPVVGEVTLAHRGVLFLDELPEFRPSAIDALRAPLEDHEVRIRRAGWIVRAPCSMQLVAAMNLCRCGNFGATSGAECTCTDMAIDAYRRRVSGAILDRFDIRVRMHAPGRIVSAPAAHSSDAARAVVARARAIQYERWGVGTTNGDVSSVNDPRLLLDSGAQSALSDVVESGADGGRMQRAVVRVARTIADIAERAEVQSCDIADAFDLCRSRISGGAA